MWERIELLIKKNNITAAKVSRETEITVSLFTQWKQGLQKPSYGNIVKLARYFNVSEDYLTGKTDNPSPLPSNLFTVDAQDFVQIPIVGQVSAGPGLLAEENIEGYESVSKDSVNGAQYVFLRVSGDSMYPVFMDGDLALIRIQDSVDSGRYAVVTIDNSVGVIKKVYYDPDWIELQSMNPMYPTKRFEKQDVLRIRVVGLVKECKRKF